MAAKKVHFELLRQDYLEFTQDRQCGSGNLLCCRHSIGRGSNVVQMITCKQCLKILERYNSNR